MDAAMVAVERSADTDSAACLVAHRQSVYRPLAGMVPSRACRSPSARTSKKRRRAVQKREKVQIEKVTEAQRAHTNATEPIEAQCCPVRGKLLQMPLPLALPAAGDPQHG